MLNDDVCQLESITKDGKYHQRLKDKNINSVEDFLKLLIANPCLLKEILKMPTNALKKVVKHAQMCPMELDNANFENNADLPNEDDFLNTQGENSPISTQLNLNFAQEPSPIHPSISTSSIVASMREQMQPICASIEKKSDRTATHNEEFSVSASVKTFEQSQGFSKGKRQWEELEQDAN